MGKLWLEEGFCPKDSYQCLMPVEYEAVESGGVVKEYKKVRMACRHVKDKGCEQEEACPFYGAAPDVLEKNANWHEP